MHYHPFTQSFEQLPEIIPIFPLAGAVVLPGGSLPLNIFEPRYLNMVQDAMRSNQIIGMIQPKNNGSEPSLYKVGCAGRIRRYEEVNGGRLEIELTGLCRFSIKDELDGIRGYRIIKADWTPYENDFNKPDDDIGADQPALLRALKHYFKENRLDTDWELIEQVDQVELVNKLFGYLPLSCEDKQLLIEAKNTNQRVKSFIAMLDQQQDKSDKTHH